MSSEAERARGPADLLDRLREKLELAEALTRAVRQALRDGDEGAIIDAENRVGTVVLEYRLLAQEYRRMREQLGADDEPATRTARSELERTATRIARSSAITGGVLERLVERSRDLMQALDPALGESYLPSGRSVEPGSSGVRLRQRA